MRASVFFIFIFIFLLRAAIQCNTVKKPFVKLKNHLSPVNFNTHFLCQPQIAKQSLERKKKKKKNKAQRCHRKQKREAAEIRNSSDNYYLRATKTLQTYTDIKRDRERIREIPRK